MEIPTYYCIDCKTEMTPLDATKTSSSWRAAAGNFGKGLIMDIVIEAGIMIGTLVSVLIFGLIWFVPGVVVFLVFYAWKRRIPENIVVTYKCPNCGKFLCTDENVMN